MRSIAIREELTEEWKNRGIKEKIEYSILTAEISKATFGLTPSEYKGLKGLKNQNLRDHMTDLELIFSMLGEASTKEIVINTDPIGFEQNKKAAKAGGKIAGDARKQLEIKSGKRVVTSENYLPESKKKILQTIRNNTNGCLQTQTNSAINQFDTLVFIRLRGDRFEFGNLYRHYPSD
jgi:DNA-damage-inducible protein D